MELMGFAFTDLQQLALFARYDESCSGEVDYSEFVEKVMESDFKGVSSGSKKALSALVSSTFLKQQNSQPLEGDDDSDIDEEEIEEFRRAEVHKLFKLVDEDSSGVIDKVEMVTLLSSLGKSLTREEIDEGFAKLDKDSSGTIDFDEFYDWYKDVAHGS